MSNDILVTGAAGFIGRNLVARLLRSGRGTDAQGRTFAFDRLIVSDRAGLETLGADPRLMRVPGDIGAPELVGTLVTGATRLVFHLAGVVSGAAEADFDAGMRVNLDGTRLLLDACRAQPEPPRLVFSSSIAVYGAPLPERIDEATPLRPTLSYGAQKVACEYLINDYARRGLVDARAIRFPGVVVRPPAPNGALSAFNSDIIREPIAARSMQCPVSAQARIWIQSIDAAVDNLLHAAQLPPNAWGLARVVTLPAIPVTIAEILDAINRNMRRVAAGGAGFDAWRHVRFVPNPDVEQMFGRLPAQHPAARARALGFACEESIDALIAACIAAQS